MPRFPHLLQFASQLASFGSARRRVTLRSAMALLVAGTFTMGCDGGNGPTAGKSAMAHPVRFALTSNLTAAEGAVVEALVTYVRPGGTIVTIAHDSMVVGASGTSATLPLTADVAGCVSDAVANSTTCTVTLTVRLKRDGRVLDESVQQFGVTPNTQTVQVPAFNLYEVATINIAPTTLLNVEPGDAATLSATAVDRSGTTLTGRPVTWEVVSGNVTVSAAGALRAVGSGPARVRATIGGRTGELTFTVGAPTVATLAIAPLDTLIAVGGSASYAVTARSSDGLIILFVPATFTSSNTAVATITNNVATGVSAGQTTITARSTAGRGGATVTTSTTLNVQAPPPILVDRTTVVLDSLAPNTNGAATTVAVTTTAGKTIGALRTAVTYTPDVTPWLNAVINPATTPTTLGLQAVSGALPPGDYAADVRITSATDPHVPATVHVTLRVVAARRVTLNPKTVNLGTYDPAQSTASPTVVTVTSSTTGLVAGLSARIEYLGTTNGWLTATLGATSAPPSTTLTLTPRPSGLAEGSYQARVIVSSTTLGASPDTTVATLTIATLGRFSGLVLSASNGVPIANASVSIRRADNSQADLVTTAADGRFVSNSLVSGTYSVVYAAMGYQQTSLSAQSLTGGIGLPVTSLPTALLVATGAGVGSISGSVRDATTNNIVVGTLVELRAGGNNLTGTIIATSTTNSDGVYNFPAQPSGTYTARGTKSGYVAGSVNVTVPGKDVSAPLIFLSPGNSTIAWRFVLSWGAVPSDLDGHLTGPLNGTTGRFHVFWNSRGSATNSPFSVLDVDQINGNGPETITIVQQLAGVYRYYVNNYSQDAALSASNARVDVYQGNTLVNQFFVPQGGGTYWTVFEISGTTLTAINTLGTSAPALVAPSALRAPASAADDVITLFRPLLQKPAATRRP
jgi:hypothetical protein